MNEKTTYEEFLKKLDGERKITLKGIYWDKAFTIITDSKKRDNSILPNPLILSGWHHSDDEEKSIRFRQHLLYAYENGKWGELMTYFQFVPDDAWYQA